MKKLFVVIIAFFAFQTISSAQVTKADVDKMLSEIGTTVDKIETLYIGNIKEFYTDGSWKKTYSKYKKKYNDYANLFFIKENGILMKTNKSGKLHSMTFYPYSEISYVYVSATAINIYLKE